MDDYDLNQILGRGGFAEVYSARNRTTGEQVAIKLVDKEKMREHGIIDRVGNEVKIHSMLKHTVAERDIEFEACLLPDPGDAGAIDAWLQERFPSNPRNRYPRSRPLTACDLREVAERLKGH